MTSPWEWPTEPGTLTSLQRRLADEQPPLWQPGPAPAVGAVFVCFPCGQTGKGERGDPGWAGAAVVRDGEVVTTAVVEGAAGAAYAAGLLALREGPLLQAAVAALLRLGAPPDLLIVNATGRDHQRRAGLASHLGAVVGLPTIGVTDRPLLAAGEWPPARRGAQSPLAIDGEVVGAWLRTRDQARPLAIHPAWRTDLETSRAVILGVTEGPRTPLPLRAARQRARAARALAQGRAIGPAGPL